MTHLRFVVANKMGKVAILYGGYAVTREDLTLLYETFPCALFLRIVLDEPEIERTVATTWLHRCDHVCVYDPHFPDKLLLYNEDGALATQRVPFDTILAKMYSDHAVVWGLL